MTTSASGSVSTTGLVVPVDVVAYCVGEVDAKQRTGAFAGATTSYTQMTGDGAVAALAGVNVLRDPAVQPPLWPLECGVHLHWAMPDGLTHAAPGDDADGLAFPALPNRWLVTRHVVTGTTITGRSWILESDTLSTTPPGGNNGPTLPVRDDSQDYRYLGVWDVFDASWQEPDIPPNARIGTLFGSQIHTVASGDVAFAAFYPNARGVFGLVDDTSDLDANGAPHQLGYTVVGWYSDPLNDPLTTTTDPADLQADYGWTYTPDVGTPDHSVYYGVAQGISWDPSRDYVTDGQTVAVDVAIGESPAQALAAYFAGRNHPGVPLFEDLFTAFEMGLLSTLQQPKPGQLAALAETVHASGFTAVDAGSMYTVVTAEASGTGPVGALADDQPPDPAPNLPLPLADGLNLLNELRQQSDLATRIVPQYQWQLFADWYRLVMADAADSQAASNTLSARLAQWPAVQQLQVDAAAAVTTQLAVVDPMLGTDWQLKEVPAPRFYQPAEPVVLLAGADLTVSARHGGDGRYDAAGYLVCRLTSQLVTSATVSAGTTTAAASAGVATITATEFPAALPPSPNHLTHEADVAALVGEAVVLNTTLAAALCQGSASTFQEALAADLARGGPPPKGDAYQAISGQLPSPVAISWWGPDNPWLPLLLLWELDFVPLSATAADGVAQPLPAELFTGSFALDPDHVGTIAYAPVAGHGGIVVDPATLDYTPADGKAAKYTGSGVLSTTAAANLTAALTDYLATHTDATLTAILDDLVDTTIVLQAMSGLNAGLLSRDLSLQLGIGVGTNAPFSLRMLTREVAGILGDLSTLPCESPDLAGSFNPLRAGFAKVQLQVLDAFGERRPAQVGNLYLSDTLTTTYDGAVEPGIVYLQPRLAQASRLLFRWLSADTLEYDEMNAHPATTPVCGWLLTNHLQEGLFLYDQLGHPLGSLVLAEDLSGVQWQPAPGNDATIGQSVATVMRDANPHLRDLAVSLAQSGAADFQAFYQAVDTAATSVSPPAGDSGSGPSVLVGRPVALVQASLLLEVQGTSAYDQTWNTLGSGQEFPDTDEGLGQVRLPAVVGDIAQLDDGLVGYFLQLAGGGYDLSTFYSEAAPVGAKGTVVQPGPTTILLSPQATPEGRAPSVAKGEQKLLMLVDPRAGVHLTTGVLPTQYAEVPATQYADTLRGLETTFLAAPVLQPLTGLTLPLGAEPGYEWSFVEEEVVAGAGPRWQVIPGVSPAIATGLWQYTPQRLTEGWLRLNPEVLQFRLANAAGAAQVTAGVATTLTLTVTNARQSTVTFTPGTLAPEGTPATGSVVYLHLGALVAAGDMAAVQPSATGWTFAAMNDPQYGAYWAATPAAGTTVALAPGQAITVTLAGLVPTTTACQAQVPFDYYDIDGVDDGVDLTVVTVVPASTTTAA